MTSVLTLPVGDEVKVTQKGDDGHSSAIINYVLDSIAHSWFLPPCAL